MPESAIADSAHLGSDTSVGRFCVIEDDVRIGAGCEVGHHVVIRAGSVVGDGARIDDHATIGKQPMRAPGSATIKGERQPPAEIGDGCLIGTSAVVYAGCTLAEGVLVADQATLREDVRVGAETIIGRGVAVENECRIGARCKLETNAYVTAYSELEDDVFVAPGVLTSNDNFMGRTEERFEHFGGVTARRGARLGVGAVVLPGKTVGREGVVAAGAVLTKDADAGVIQAGVPARRFREVPEEQKLSDD